MELGGVDFEDVEDIAIGPGPEAGVDYIYVSDTGNNDKDRDVVQIYRIREPDMSKLAELFSRGRLLPGFARITWVGVTFLYRRLALDWC